MKTSRQRLLEYIQSQRAATANDISQALNMTTANARHHLGILHEQGAIEIIGYQPRGGKGRPAQIFGPGHHGSRDNLVQLSGALMDEIEYLSPVDAHRGSLERISHRLVPPLRKKVDHAKLHLTQRLYGAIQQLNKHNYHARWEAHIDAPRLILGHCPYKAIVDQYPDICQIDALILESLLAEPVDQITKLAPDGRGVPVCVFEIHVKR
jgi:predicted ArsR family transcriptional regulator